MSANPESSAPVEAEAVAVAEESAAQAPPVVAVPAEETNEKATLPPSMDSIGRTPSAMGMRRGASMKKLDDGTVEEVVEVGPYAKVLTAYPGFVMLGIIVFIGIFCGGVGIPGYFAMFEGGEARRSMEAQKSDAFLVAQDDTKKYWDARGPGGTGNVIAQEPYTQSVYREQITFWFESKSGQIFSDANINSVVSILDQANQIVKDSGVCLKCPSTEGLYPCVEDLVVTGCRPADSLMHLARSQLGQTPSNAVAKQALATIGITPEGQQAMNRYVGKDVDVQAGTATWARGYVEVGGPFENYDNLTHSEEEQWEKYELFYKAAGDMGTPKSDGWIAKFDDIIAEEQKRNKDLVVYYGGGIHQILPRMFAGLFVDVGFAVAAMLFVGTFMWIQLGSVFLTMIGMIEILASFALALSTWKIFGNTSFTFMHMLVIYIILGIGADDIFVFADAWKQGRAQPDSISKDTQKRFQWALSRASAAMLVTSVTTCAAFLLTGMTDLPIISTFGTFSSIVIIWDFILVVSLFPAAVVFHDRYFVNKNNGFCVSHACGCLCTVCAGQWGLDTANKDPAAKSQGEEKKDLRSIELFFHDSMWGALDKFHIRMFVFGLFGILSIVGISLAATDVKLTTRSVTETFLVESNILQQTLNLMLGTNKAFKAGDSDMKRGGYVFFGIDAKKPIDRKGTDPIAEDAMKQKGKVNYVSDDLTSPDTQLRVIEACDKVADLASVAKNPFSRPVANQSEVWCFMKDFKTYRENQNPPLPFPVPESDLVRELARWKDDETYTGPGSYWNPMRTGVSQQGDQANDALYDLFTAWIPEDDGVRMKAMYISGNLSTALTEQDLDIIRPENAQWEDAGEELNQKYPSVQIMGVTERAEWIAIMDALVAGVVTGIPASLAIALAVLTIATANWMVACLATLSIVGVMASFFITFSLANWVLGMYECMFLQLTVGMAVDYIVHLAHAYNEAGGATRSQKMREALTEMGVSVLSGAISTLGASIFLFIAQFNVFFLYGSFIFFVIAWSLIWALVFFPALMIQVGPQGNSGDMVWLRNLKAKLTGAPPENNAAQVMPAKA